MDKHTKYYGWNMCHNLNSGSLLHIKWTEAEQIMVPIYLFKKVLIAYEF